VSGKSTEFYDRIPVQKEFAKMRERSRVYREWKKEEMERRKRDVKGKWFRGWWERVWLVVVIRGLWWWVVGRRSLDGGRNWLFETVVGHFSERKVLIMDNNMVF
jgi:hypothetical protein